MSGTDMATSLGPFWSSRSHTPSAASPSHSSSRLHTTLSGTALPTSYELSELPLAQCPTSLLRAVRYRPGLSATRCFILLTALWGIPLPISYARRWVLGTKTGGRLLPVCTETGGMLLPGSYCSSLLPYSSLSMVLHSAIAHTAQHCSPYGIAL
eukprot:873398-Rhodomonas_salina.2